MNEKLRGNIDTVTFQAMGGDELNKFKENVREFCLRFDCKAILYHNSKVFVCDREGNIAQTN